jgi:glutathione synthase/RimK-type ligase-like ATP-grasp enzyme
MGGFKFAILKNEMDHSHVRWQTACETFAVDYKIIDLIRNQWLDFVNGDRVDCFLACPAGLTSRFKQLYDERLNIISKVLGLNVFPAYEAVVLHENKRFLSDWLKANRLPHPRTDVFYYKEEALGFTRTARYPIVAKTVLGASGSGVKVLRDVRSAEAYINRAFSGKGISPRVGPNLKMGNLWGRLKRVVRDPAHLNRRLGVYKSVFQDPQRGFVLFQEYVPHEFEWRAVRIGNSYFAHKKIKVGDKCSGTKGIDYVDPPKKLLNFVKNVCENHHFDNMAVDLFDDGEGGYLINEMQTMFGHVQEHILEVNGRPGRYLFKNNRWIFEEGLFNANESYDLRLGHVLGQLKGRDREDGLDPGVSR